MNEFSITSIAERIVMANELKNGYFHYVWQTVIKFQNNWKINLLYSYEDATDVSVTSRIIVYHLNLDFTKKFFNFDVCDD